MKDYCEECFFLKDYERRYHIQALPAYGFAQDEPDADSSPNNTHVVKPKGRRNTGARYRRRMDAKKKAEELRNIDLGKGRSWASYDYVDGTWVRVGNFAKHPKHSNIKKLMKRNTNKAVRRNPETYKGNQYRKVHDRWAYD